MRGGGGFGEEPGGAEAVEAEISLGEKRGSKEKNRKEKKINTYEPNTPELDTSSREISPSTLPSLRRWYLPNEASKGPVLPPRLRYKKPRVLEGV